jgi:enhancer of polycomb-like protein
LQGPGASTDKEIPVPPPQESKLSYDELYPLRFCKTSTYIRFSQTVEECIGCQYDMTEDDDIFLKSYNQKQAAFEHLSEDDFETVMDVFEDTSIINTPFASVDNTIVPYGEMAPGLQQLEADKLIQHPKEIYEYWRNRRQKLGKRPLHPSLKFETHQDSDDMDPYVCFRRREARQTRKTRARDAQSAEKLKRLRRELEDGRRLIISSHEREILKRDLLNTERLIFEQRDQLKEIKIRLGIKTDDDDLVNQKVSLTPAIAVQCRTWAETLQREKRKPMEVTLQRPAPTQLRLPVRTDGRSPEADFVQLSEKLAEKEKELRTDIEIKVQNHNIWNRNHVDLTRGPLSPIKGHSLDLSFRPAKTQYLMTPPASASSESMEEPTAMELDQPEAAPLVTFRGVSPQDDQSSSSNPPAFRRRIGRLNRLWIDRRGLASPPREPSNASSSSDRWKYDQDSDDEDRPPLYAVDPFDTRALKFRALIPPLASMVASQVHRKALPPEVLANHNREGGQVPRPALPPSQHLQTQPSS